MPEINGPLKLAPQPIARPWGGRALVERYGKPVPEDGAPLGETWEASDLPGRVSRIATGPLAGMPIDEALGRPLPLLIKLLDCAQTISVQVHPDEQSAEELGVGVPKTEAWHILWSEPGGSIYYGAKPGVSTDQLLTAAKSGVDSAVESLLNRFPVTLGDTIFVPAGTVHAIGKGVVIYEVSQTSDTTFRIYDWNRPGLDGRPRALHIPEATNAIRGPTRSDPRRETELVPGANPRIMLCRCPAFRLDLLLIDSGEFILSESRHVTFVTAVGGDGVIRSDAGEEEIKRGETFCVPHETESMIRPGPRGLRLLHARIPKQSVLQGPV